MFDRDGLHPGGRGEAEILDFSLGNTIMCQAEFDLDGCANLKRLAEIGLMTAGVVHDMGNLMQVINSGTRMATGKLASGDSIEALEAIACVTRAADRASKLSRSLLDRISFRSAVTQPIDLSSAIPGMAQALKWAAGTSVLLEIILLSSPLLVECDLGSLEDALLNLTLNARDAMPSGGRVSISAQNIEIDGRRLAEIRVSDTGVGMSPEIAARAFEPFFSSKTAGTGTGLGLASVAAFARELGGEAFAESELDKGATIVLRIPTDDPS